MPTPTQEYDWNHRYDPDANHLAPAHHDIDSRWYVIKSIVTADGAFNGGIDLVENRATKQLAIRKRLRRHKHGDRFDYLHWRREISVLRKLNHRNITYYIDAFYTEERGSIYMQPCRLGSVSSFVDNRKHMLSPAMQEFFLWYILHEAAQAVLYMQTGFKDLAEAERSNRDCVRGWVSMVHADIRTDQLFMTNSLADPTPQIVLGDFGFSQCIKPWHYKEAHDGPGGKSPSKAPEFPEEISEATDVFGLGVTGQLYVAPNDHLGARLLTGYLTQLGISVELDKLICHCVAHRPCDRPDIFQVLRGLEWGLAEQRKEGLSLKMLTGPLFKSLYPAT